MEGEAENVQLLCFSRNNLASINFLHVCLFQWRFG